MEDCRPFVRIAAMLHDAGVHAPRVLAQDLDRGFLLLTDLGSTYLPRRARTRRARADALPRGLRRAGALAARVARGRTAALRRRGPAPRARPLPRVVPRASPRPRARRGGARDARAHVRARHREQPRAAARLRAPRLPLAQPDGVGAEPRRPRLPGRASTGRSPTTSSRCCATPTSPGTRKRRSTWAVRYWERARKAALPVDADFGVFWRDFEWMGVQRQLKVLGIFARLAHRDGKHGYLADMPRVMALPARRLRALRRARAAARADRPTRRPRAARGRHVLTMGRATAMILAAGRGERLRPITDTIPKPLVEVAGKPLVVHQLEALARAGHRDVAINAAHLADQLVDALGDGRAFGLRLHWSIEPEALETAGGIATAFPLLAAGPVLIVSGDLWTDFDYATLEAPHRRDPPRPGRRARCTSSWSPIRPGTRRAISASSPGDPGGSASQMRPADAAPPSGAPMLTFGNIGVYDAALFAELPRGAKLKLAAPLPPVDRGGRGDRRALRRPLGQRGHARRPGRAARPRRLTDPCRRRTIAPRPGRDSIERNRMNAQSAARFLRPPALRLDPAGPRHARDRPPDRRGARDRRPRRHRRPRGRRGARVAEPLADALDHLHRAWGAVRHLNSVVNTPELRDAYNGNLPKLTVVPRRPRARTSACTRGSARSRPRRSSPRSTPRAAA